MKDNDNSERVNSNKNQTFDICKTNPETKPSTQSFLHINSTQDQALQSNIPRKAFTCIKKSKKTKNK